MTADGTGPVPPPAKPVAAPEAPSRPLLPPKAGSVVDLTGDELSYGPETVARHPDGMVVFVPYLAPGDRAPVRIESVRKNHARGVIAGPVAPGPCRASPPCPLFGTCGGCQWQHVSLAAQREAKERIIRRRLSLDTEGGVVAPLRAGTSALAYRNRLILPLRQGRDGLRAGFFRALSHSLIDVDACPVQHPALWAAAGRAVALLDKSGQPAWDERVGRGVLRHVVARRAAGTGQVGIIVVVNGEGFPGEREMAEELLRQDPAIVGVSVNSNTSLTNVILGPATRTVAGRGKLEDDIGGLRLVASPESFFQANHEVTAMMLELLVRWAQDPRLAGAGVLDLYCGTGILGIAAARAIAGAIVPPPSAPTAGTVGPATGLPAARAIAGAIVPPPSAPTAGTVGPATGLPAARASLLRGVEEVPAAAEDAAANARANGVPSAEFVPGPAGTVLPGLVPGEGGYGLVILDPPRKGAEPEVLRAAAGLGAPVLVYVSCDPMTFARDLRHLREGGYCLREVVPFDMFPHTYHVELMARLERES